MTIRKKLLAIASLLLVCGTTMVLSQGAGPGLLTTLSATYQVPIVTTGPLNTNTTLATLKTFIQSGGTAGPISATTIVASGVITPTGGIAAAGGFTASPHLVMTGNWKPLAITDGTEVTCTTTTTYVAQVFVPANMTVTGVALVNATAVAGNLTVGLATSAGAPITAAQSATTAASGTAAYQRVPFATPYAAVGPATYYVQLQCNNTGYKFRAHTVGDFPTQTQTSGTYGTIIAFTPASTFTTAVGPVASFY